METAREAPVRGSQGCPMLCTGDSSQCHTRPTTGAGETSNKEEKGEEKGAAKRNKHVLTLDQTPCARDPKSLVLQRHWVGPEVMARGGEVSGMKMNFKMRCFPLARVCHLCFSISNAIIKCLCKLAGKLNSLSQICFAFKTPIFLKFHCRTDTCSAPFIQTYKSIIGGETGPAEESKRAAFSYERKCWVHNVFCADMNSLQLSSEGSTWLVALFVWQ